MKYKKKILIINQHFSTGGIKKSLDNMIPFLLEEYDVNIVFISGRTDLFDKKYPGIRIKSPFILSSYLSSLKEIKKMSHPSLRTLIKMAFFLLSMVIGGENTVHLAIRMSKMIGKYDCVISYAHDNWSDSGNFYGGSNFLALKKTYSDNKITWIHGEPKTFGLTYERLIKIYPYFNSVVAVSDSVKKQFEEMSQKAVTCKKIYNLIDIDEIKQLSKDVSYKQQNECFRIVTVGRLSKIAKRIDKVNEIAKLLKQDGYTFKWTVVGGGSEFESCEHKKLEYGLENYVYYIGNQENPYKYMKESDLFVLVSDTEAMPLVINESMIVGTPVITTDFPAAYESVKDGITGYIVKKDVESLYKKISFCIDHRDQLETFRNNINNDPYSNEESIKQLKGIIG